MGHIYNLRKSDPYKRKRWLYDKTKSKSSSIGEGRKPDPNGKPGYIRIDTVHQGDLDGEKGVYHINAVDEVTQFEVVCAVEKISEQYLIPVLEQLLNTFPFVILGFHSDNGSEYINQYVVALLKNYILSLQNRGQDIQTIMRWLKQKWSDCSKNSWLYTYSSALGRESERIS